MRSLKLLLFVYLLVCAGDAKAGKAVSDAAFKLPERGLCAHRGAMDTHPENTLAGFREAIRCGAHMIEFDVYLTKDKRLVVIHDSSVDRTTNGKGKVAELTFDEIRALDAGSWKAPEFKGEKIPTLKEALAVMPMNIWLNVHLKGGEELGRKTAKVIAGQNRLHQAFLACGASAAKGAKSAVHGILICNMDRQSSSASYVNGTLKMKADFIQLCGAVSPEYSEFTKTLKKNGVRINYFGTDSPEKLKKLFELGVEFPLVNKVADSMKVATALGIKPLKPVFGEEKILRDIAYDTDDVAQKIDVYLARSQEPAPVMVFIHGGGWRAGSKKGVPAFLRKAHAEGWLAVVSVEYRFTNVAVHPAQVDDCARAIQFVRQNAKKWNIDPKRIGVTGGSAGGHLSAYIALQDDEAKPASSDPVERQSSRVLFAIPFAGPSDWRLLSEIKHTHPAYRQLIGYEPGTPTGDMAADRIKDVSPLNFVSADDPPVLIVHGDADHIVPIEHAKVLESALKKVGAEVELYVVKGGTHGVAGAGGEAAVYADAYMRKRLGY